RPRPTPSLTSRHGPCPKRTTEMPARCCMVDAPLIWKLPLPESFEAGYLDHNGILPIEIVDDRLRVAIADAPAPEVLDDLEMSFGLALDLVPVSREVLSDGIRRAYAAAESVVELVRDLDALLGAAGESGETPFTVFAVSGLALVSLGAPRSSARMRALEAARAQALRTGIPVAVVDSVSPVVFLPDGRALGTGVDALTGALNATRSEEHTSELQSLAYLV